jgi:hypothetical protein
MIKIGAMACGAFLLLAGIVAFVPGAIVFVYGIPQVLGVFAVDATQNGIHIASGAIGLIAASSERYAKWYLQIFGLAYAAVAVVGLVQGDTVLGLFAVNLPTNLLHVALATALLGCGFGLPTENGFIHMNPPKPPIKPAM